MSQCVDRAPEGGPDRSSPVLARLLLLLPFHVLSSTNMFPSRSAQNPAETVSSIVTCKMPTQTGTISTAKIELTLSTVSGVDPLSSNKWTAAGPTTIQVDMVRRPFF